MRLRRLYEKDAPLMLEWMHDDFVVSGMGTDFIKKTIEDCQRFIEEAKKWYADVSSASEIHFAIADDDDTYVGTVSLKDIDRVRQKAEFAIVVRRTAMGKGFAQYGMQEILKTGFSSLLNLQMIYWCVDSKNSRALRFYDKQSFERIEADDDMISKYRNIIGGGTELIWYSVQKKSMIL